MSQVSVAETLESIHQARKHARETRKSIARARELAEASREDARMLLLEARIVRERIQLLTRRRDGGAPRPT